MTTVQITCITKSPRDNTHAGITHLGNSSGKWTRVQVVGWIESGEYSFYTLVNGVRADIGVVNGEHGKYLQTHGDGRWNNNLLALAECP